MIETFFAVEKQTMLNMKPETSDIEAVIRQAIEKYEKGRMAYGQLNLSGDPRDFIDEAISELEDCINYCVFQIIRLRSMGNGPA